MVSQPINLYNACVYSVCVTVLLLLLFDVNDWCCDEAICIDLTDRQVCLSAFCLSSLRAAQKLNLASKKKKQKAAVVAVPARSSSPSCDPHLFSTNFCSALLMAPPPAPPCLLRAANKIKDTPGLGKVNCVRCKQYGHLQYVYVVFHS